MKRTLFSSLALVAALALSACGGGGSDSPSAAGGSAPDGGSPLPGTPLANDPLAMVSSATPVGGVIPSGAARNVTAKYHGPATSGELMEITVNFQTLTYTWTVAQSAFGIDGQTASGTLTANADGGGYHMSSGGTLLIMNTGSLFVTGFALTIDGLPVSQALFAQPLTGEVTTISDIVGTYTFGQFNHEKGAHFPYGPGTATVAWGSTTITASGAMDVCQGASTACQRRTLSFSDGRCPTNLIGVTAPSGTFIGCMVVSKGIHGTVLSLDMQALGGMQPGTTIFVQRPAEQYTLSTGTYATVKVADLANDPDGCTSNPFVANADTTLVGKCGPADALVDTVFSINTMAPLPSKVNGLIIDNELVGMLLPIADGMWIVISPTGGWDGTTQERGQILVLIRK